MTEMRPPLQADRLYMENRIEIQNMMAQMAQRGRKRIAFAGDKEHCQSFMNVTWLTRMQPSILVWQPTGDLRNAENTAKLFGVSVSVAARLPDHAGRFYLHQ